jgi:hypothetical protein
VWGDDVRTIRRLVYRMGFRPKPGSIFFSPSIAYAEVFHKAVMNAIDSMRKSYGEEKP